MAAYGCTSRTCASSGLAFVLLITPMMVPVVLVAIGAFYIYVKLNLVYHLLGLVLAHSMLAIPLVVIVTGSALKSYDMNQENLPPAVAGAPSAGKRF